MNLDDRSIDKLYGIFREKMQDVYRKNYKSDPFGSAMATEFNAWQKYLRDSLRLEVVDAEHGDEPGILHDRSRGVRVKLPNPSNAADYGSEFIIVSAELAEKILALGSLPEQL